MENSNDSKMPGECQCEFCHVRGCRCSCHRGHRILRVLVSLAIVVIIFVIGMAVGSVGSRYRYSMMNYAGFGGSSVSGAWTKGGMMYGFGSAEQVFGVIKSIDGNKITITNNADQQQVVATSASTVIVSSSSGQQMSISDLKSGQKISVTGNTDQGSQFLARVISIQ